MYDNYCFKHLIITKFILNVKIYLDQGKILILSF